MSILIANEARKSLYKIIDNVAISHEPITIKGKRNSVVVIAQDDWDDIQETLLVAANPKLSKSIIKGLNTSYKDCRNSLED